MSEINREEMEDVLSKIMTAAQKSLSIEAESGIDLERKNRVQEFLGIKQGVFGVGNEEIIINAINKMLSGDFTRTGFRNIVAMAESNMAINIIMLEYGFDSERIIAWKS